VCAFDFVLPDGLQLGDLTAAERDQLGAEILEAIAALNRELRR
jgi:hypothetical protein